MKPKKDYINCCLAGFYAVGKTTLVQSMTNTLKEGLTPISTVAPDFYSLDLDGRTFKIYDTAGQEKFQSMSFLHVKHAEIIFLLFDFSNMDSFIDLDRWMEQIRNNARDPLIYLIGNKTDLTHVVQYNVIQNYMKDHNINYFFDISAKFNQNVYKIINQLKQYTVKSEKESEDEVNVELEPNELKVKSEKSCACTIF